MSNKVTFGLRNLHIAFHDNKGGFEEPIRIPGVVSWTPSAVGEATEFYADDMLYYRVQSNNGYEGDLTLAKIPDEVLAEMLGWEYDEETGVLTELGDGNAKPFAMLFEVQGDEKKRRTVQYNCVASRPAKELQTNAESPEVNPDQLTVTVSPFEEEDGTVVIKRSIEQKDSNKEIFDKFFDEVFTGVKEA